MKISLKFEEISRKYQRARDVSGRQGAMLKAICEVRIDDLGRFGSVNSDIIRNRHVAEVAQKLYPTASNSTRNRCVIVPVNAALRWAAIEELIGAAPIISRFKEAKVLSRRPAADAIEGLIAAVDGDEQRAFLILLRCQGWRLSEAMGLKWADVDLENGSVIVWVGKARAEKVLPLHPDTVAALAGLKQIRKHVFPWRSSAQVYAWLKPLCARLDIRFTPHMARHEFASRLNELCGATPSDLKHLGTWTTEASIGRYISPSNEHTRAMLARL
jgi:integrase